MPQLRIKPAIMNCFTYLNSIKRSCHSYLRALVPFTSANRVRRRLLWVQLDATGPVPALGVPPYKRQYCCLTDN